MSPMLLFIDYIVKYMKIVEHLMILHNGVKMPWFSRVGPFEHFNF
jgi:hypothetical protein